MGNVKVELKSLPSTASFEMKDRAFKGMFAAFKRRVNDYGILAEFNQRQYYESRGQKVRRRQKESDLARRKEAAIKAGIKPKLKDKDKDKNDRGDRGGDRDYFFQQ